MPPIQNSFDASLNTLSTSVNCFLVAMSTGVSPCMFFFFFLTRSVWNAHEDNFLTSLLRWRWLAPLRSSSVTSCGSL